MESANPTVAVSWSDLPPELLAHVSKRLRTKIDRRRFRAVCRSWRSSTPPYKFPTIKLPFPFNDNLRGLEPKHNGAYFTLTERIVYRIQLPDSKDPDFWLVKVELDENGTARILNPVTHRKIKISTELAAQKVFNILDFDVTEVCSGYALRHAAKVVYSATEGNGEYEVTAVDFQYRLWHIKSGCEKWNFIRTCKFSLPIYDVAIVKGKYHVSDWCGGVWPCDSEFVRPAEAPIRYTSSIRRRLVELYNGELVMVEEMPKCAFDPNKKLSFQLKEPNVVVGVYALSEQSNTWIHGKAMSGCIIVSGDDCSYSVPTTPQLKGVRVFYPNRYCFVKNRDFDDDLEGYTGVECDCREICNCFDDIGLENFAVGDLVSLAAGDEARHVFEGFYGHNVGVYDYESGNSGTALMFPEYASIFWPPPAWLNRT